MSAPLEHTLLAITFDKHVDNRHHLKVPPHITVMPWFKINHPVAMHNAQYAISQTDPFKIRQGEPITVGGPGHEKPAMTVISEELIDLHKRLFERLVHAGVELPDPEWLSDNYLPHYRKDKGIDPFQKTDEIRVTDIAIIRNLGVVGLGENGVKEITYKRLGTFLG